MQELASVLGHVVREFRSPSSEPSPSAQGLCCSVENNLHFLYAFGGLLMSQTFPPEVCISERRSENLTSFHYCLFPMFLDLLVAGIGDS